MLTECPECQKQISSRARLCPFCGRPLRSSPVSPTAGLVAFIIVLLAFLIYIVRSFGPPPPTQTNSLSSPIQVNQEIVVIEIQGVWKREDIVWLLYKLRDARRAGRLSQMGVNLSGEVGFVYLIDGRHEIEHLQQFTQEQNPGFAIVAPAVRAFISWPSERLVLGYRTGSTDLSQ